MQIINRLLYSHNMWLFARKILIKFPFLYKFFLRKKNIKDFHKKLLTVKNQDYGVIEKDFYDNLEIFTNKFKNIKNNSNVFFMMDMPWAWEPSYFFKYLKNIFWYLVYKNCNLYIITNNSYKYVTRLYTKYFNIEYLFYDKKIPEDIYDFIKTKKWVIVDSVWYPDTYNLFLKAPEKWSVYYSLDRVEEFMLKWLWNKFKWETSKDYEFIEKDLDSQKLSNITKFVGWDKLILCNFESKCWNMVNEYKIKTEDIINKLSNIKGDNIKIFINSVYDWCTFKWTNNLMVGKLNFQEIIWLAEKNIIREFVSYRNGINDLFFIFYPDIQQVIYYPDEYMWNVSKSDYWKYMKNNVDLKCDWIHRWWLPQRKNIKQYLKKDLLNTIEFIFNDV